MLASFWSGLLGTLQKEMPSPADVDIFQKFYQLLPKEFRLHPKARLVGQSNGGLIAYGRAFRYPHQVDRVLGILRATDFRSWPGMNKVIGPGAITPLGLAYPLTLTEMAVLLTEFNPIDNLKLLAETGVEALHLHGDQDELVSMEDNSTIFIKRFHAHRGVAELLVLKGLGHRGQEFYDAQEAVHFLLG